MSEKYGTLVPTGRLLDDKPRTILYDATKCIGCRQCVEACKDWNELPRGDTERIGGTTWLTIEPPVMEGQSPVWGRNSCMHCEYPLCAAVCPVEAITKYEEGPVVIDPALCIGCGFCSEACPWQAIGKDQTSGKAAKCTLCQDRLVGGAAPFCVSACPAAGALEFGLLEVLRAKAAQRAAAGGAAVYGESEAGGTQVLHVLNRAPAEHGLAAVPAQRFPPHRAGFGTVLRILLSGGLSGKWRALENALRKPWRLKYRYWPDRG
jgi:formate dehydrogenase iron-sulfur subunit